MDIAKQNPESLELANRKIAKMDCRLENDTWLLEDLGEEELGEDDLPPQSDEVEAPFQQAPSSSAGVSDDDTSERATTTPICTATSAGTNTRSPALVCVGRSINTGGVVNDITRSQKVGEGGNGTDAMEEVAHVNPLPHVGLACDENECIGLKLRCLHKSLMKEAGMNHGVVVRLCEELLVDSLAELREIEDDEVNDAFRDDEGTTNLGFDTVIKSRKAKKLLKKFIKVLKRPHQHRPMILGFFAKQISDTVRVHQEAQQMMNLLSDTNGPFACNIQPEPTYSDFQNLMLKVNRDNVRILHFAGHGKEYCGFLWLNANGEYEEIKNEKFAKMLKTEALHAYPPGTVECVVLNACETYVLGKLLRDCGIPYVVCWRTKVQDSTARIFTDTFYRALKDQKVGEWDHSHTYFQAFLRAKNSLETASRGLDVVWFLSEDDDDCPEVQAASDDTPDSESNGDGGGGGKRGSGGGGVGERGGGGEMAR